MLLILLYRIFFLYRIIFNIEKKENFHKDEKFDEELSAIISSSSCRKRG